MIRINCLQVPFKENVCTIVPVETCNPVTVTKCSDKTKNVRFQINAHRPSLDMPWQIFYVCRCSKTNIDKYMQVCHDVTEDVERDVCMLMTRNDCRQVGFFSITALSFKIFFVMNCYESYWWFHCSKEWWKYGFMPFWWTTLNNQVPTKVCNQEEVPLCTKQEVAETKKVDHHNDIQLEKFQWSTTHYTGVRECPHGGLPRHRWEVHTRCLRL